MKEVSIVWNYFEKTADERHVKCLVCGKYLRYFKNTTNLRHHLIHVHSHNLQENNTFSNNESMEFTICKLENLEPLPVTFEIISSDSPSTSQAMEAELEINYDKEASARPRTSIVWNYFTKSDDQEFVSCNLCHRSIKFFRSTTNLRRHLRGKHSLDLQETEVSADNEENIECVEDIEDLEQSRPIAYAISDTDNQPSEVPEKETEIVLHEVSFPRKSIVWNYFDRSSDRRFVTCRMCGKIMRYFGNTTNLRSHLKRSHLRTFQKNVIRENGEQEANCTNGNSSSVAEKETVENIQKEGKSIVWNYFKKIPDKNVAVCTFCKKYFKFFSTTNLKGHLNRIHPNWLRKSKLSLIKAEPYFSPVLKRARLSSFDKKCTLSDHRRKEIDTCIVTMLATSYQPLSLIENQGFLEYSKKLQPSYTPPSRDQLVLTIIPEFYNESFVKLKATLDLVNTVSVTIDSWISNENRSFLTITCHFIDDDKLYDYVLTTKEISNVSDSESSLSIVLAVFSEWNVFDKIVTVVSNSTDIEKCVNAFLKSHHPCIVHTLNTAISDVLLVDENLCYLMEKCKDLAYYLKSNSSFLEKFQNIQKQMEFPRLKIKLDRGTWYSKYFMMKRLVEVKDPLSIILTDLPGVPYFLDSYEWDAISDCVSLLEPLELIITELLPEKYPTMSIVIPLIRGLYYSLQNKVSQTEIGILFRNHLLNLTSASLESLESNTIVAKSTFLDPRFKNLAFGSESKVDNICNWIAEELVEVIGTNDIPDSSTSEQEEKSNFIWAYFDTKVAKRKSASTPFSTVKSMMTQYLEMPHLERNKDPLEFWKEHKTIFPELYGVAIKYLCVPATAVPPERLFTMNGRLSNTYRNCLPSKNLDQMIFLNSFLNRQPPMASTYRETLPNSDGIE